MIIQMIITIRAALAEESGGVGKSRLEPNGSGWLESQLSYTYICIYIYIYIYIYREREREKHIIELVI